MPCTLAFDRGRHVIGDPAKSKQNQLNQKRCRKRLTALITLDATKQRGGKRREGSVHQTRGTGSSVSPNCAYQSLRLSMHLSSRPSLHASFQNERVPVVSLSLLSYLFKRTSRPNCTYHSMYQTDHRTHWIRCHVFDARSLPHLVASTVISAVGHPNGRVPVPRLPKW